MHLIGDCDTIIHKACWATERKVYDILPLDVPPWVDLEDPNLYNQFVIKSFKYVKEYNEWLKQHGKTKEDFQRIDRTVIEPLSHALHLINTMMEGMIADVEPEQVSFWLTGSTNFRDKVATVRPYKEDRRDKPKPKYFYDARDHLVRRWNAQIVEGCEADDICCMIAHSSMDDGHPFVVAHIDKDLNSIPGWHYHFEKKTWYWVSTEEAIKWFYIQVLAGDTTDCVPGLKGVAEKTARKMLGKAKTEETMWKKVLEAYRNDPIYKKDERGPEAVALEMARLVHMQRWPGDMWVPPC